MEPAKRSSNNKESALYKVLKSHLGLQAEGQSIIAAFEKDPQSNSEALASYLRKQLSEDTTLANEIAQALGDTAGAQINNIIMGGEIDQIINIARLGVLNLTVEKKVSVFRDAKQLLIFITIFLFVAGGIYASYWYSIQPKKFTGDFNIAIAVGEYANDGSIKSTKFSKDFSDSLVNYLNGMFNASDFGLDVDVSNDHMKLSNDPHVMEDLASQVGATIVIYGTISTQGNEVKFTPQFYVSPRFGVDELRGTTALEKPIIFHKETFTDVEIGQKDFNISAAILVNFVYSLIYLFDNKLDEAAVYVEQAIRTSETSESFDGQESLYLLDAAIKTAQEKYDIANQLLDHVLEIKPGYARVYIARGNIYYGQATKTEPYDEILLEKALTEYKKAYEASYQPPGSYIPIKSYYSIGNIYLVKAENTNDDPELYKKAIENYQHIVDKYEEYKKSDYPDAATSIQNLVAVTYFNLGFSYERIGEFPDAIRAYENALNLTTNPKDKDKIKNQLEHTKVLLNSQ